MSIVHQLIDKRNDYHTEDVRLASYIQEDGHSVWHKHGQRHRENDLPAVINSKGLYWYKNNKFHRDNGPAVILADGTMKWFTDGVETRVYTPSNDAESGDAESGDAESGDAESEKPTDTVETAIRIIRGLNTGNKVTYDLTANTLTF